MFLAEGKKNGPMWIRFSGRMKRMARRGGVETLPGKLTRVKKKKGEEEKKNNGEGQRGGWNQLALKTGGVTLEKKKEEGGEILFSCSSGGNEFSVRSLEGAELSRSKVPS